MPVNDNLKNEVGVVVLCGGTSERMGFDKWRLPVGNVTMLDHILAKVREFSNGIVVCCGNDGGVSSQFPDVDVIPDDFANCGPLEGIRCGLAALADRYQYAFVTACDVPWADATVVNFLHQQIDGLEAAIPVINDRVYGMTAVYRTDTHSKIRSLVEARQLKVSLLAEQLNARQLGPDQFSKIDPDFKTLQNINEPADYLNYLKETGNECPEELMKLLMQ